MKGLGPCMAQVTSVASPFGASVNSTMLWPSKGSIMSSFIVTRVGAVSTMAMLPLPTSLLPAKR